MSVTGWIPSENLLLECYIYRRFCNESKIP